jgi:hypothetical protein
MPGNLEVIFEIFDDILTRCLPHSDVLIA